MCQLPITEVTDIHVQIIDESVGGIVNAECVKETYLLDTEDVYVGHLFWPSVNASPGMQPSRLWYRKESGKFYKNHQYWCGMRRY